MSISGRFAANATGFYFVVCHAVKMYFLFGSKSSNSLSFQFRAFSSLVYNHASRCSNAW